MGLKQLLVDELETAKMSGFDDLQGEDASCLRTCQKNIWLQDVATAAVGSEHGVVGADVRVVRILEVDTCHLCARKPHWFGITWSPCSCACCSWIHLAKDIPMELDECLNVQGHLNHAVYFC